MPSHSRIPQARDPQAASPRTRDRVLGSGAARGSIAFLAGAGVATLSAILIGSAAEAPRALVAPAATGTSSPSNPEGEVVARLGELLHRPDTHLAEARGSRR